MSRKARVFSKSEIFIGFHLLEPILNNTNDIDSIRELVRELILNERLCCEGPDQNMLFRSNDSAAVLSYRHFKYIAKKVSEGPLKTQELINHAHLFEGIDPPGTKYLDETKKMEIKNTTPGQFCSTKEASCFFSISQNTKQLINDERGLADYITSLCELRDEKTLPLISCLDEKIFKKVLQTICLPEQIYKNKSEFAEKIINYLAISEPTELIAEQIRALESFIAEIPEYKSFDSSSIIAAVQWSVLCVRLTHMIAKLNKPDLKLTKLLETLNSVAFSVLEDFNDKDKSLIKTLDIGTIPVINAQSIQLIKHIVKINITLKGINDIEDKIISSTILKITGEASLASLKDSYRKQQEKALEQLKFMSPEKIPTPDDKFQLKMKKSFATAIDNQAMALFTVTNTLSKLEQDKRTLELVLRSPEFKGNTQTTRSSIEIPQSLSTLSFISTLKPQESQMLRTNTTESKPAPLLTPSASVPAKKPIISSKILALQGNVQINTFKLPGKGNVISEKSLNNSTRPGISQG